MQLNFKRIGEGEPLVILHGLFGTLDNWQTLGQHFGETRQVLMVDQRNHGRSPHVDSISFDELAADLAAFLDELGLREVDVLGHSMGGKTAMQFALNYPGRVRKLVVVDMGVKQYERGHDAIIQAMKSLPLEENLSRQELDEKLSAGIPEWGVRQFLLKNLRRRPEGGYAWKMNLPVLERDYHKILEPMHGEPWMGDALFIRGGESRYVLDEDWSDIQLLFPLASLATIAGAGHWVHAEKPDELYELVEPFLLGMA